MQSTAKGAAGKGRLHRALHWTVMVRQYLFCSATGSRNNWLKTRVLLPPGPRSAEAEAEISRFKLKLPPFGEPQRYLGTYLNCKIEDAWGPVLQGVAEKIALLQSFHLSLLGRVLAARVYLLSKVWFTAAALYLPSPTLRQLNRMVFNYIHGSSTPQDRSIPGRLSRELALSRAGSLASFLRAHPRTVVLECRTSPSLLRLTGFASCHASRAAPITA